MSVWELDLPWDRPPLSLNQRLHWARKAQISRAVKEAVQLIASAKRLPRGLEAAAITLHWQPTVNRRRDVDNPTPTLKAAVDALVLYGLVADDDSAHVLSGCRIEPVADVARLWLRIVELDRVP